MVISPHVMAQSQCHLIDDDAQRLACYDQTHHNKGTAEPMDDTRFGDMSFNQVVDYYNDRDVFKLTPHRANYILPFSYNSSPNQEDWSLYWRNSELDDFEAKFQISGKLKIWKDIYSDWDLWLAYTQTSWWQIYNGENSAPIRETNYSPELILSTYPNVSLLGFDLVQADFAFVHHSNGEDGPFSRSWNRLYTNLEFTRDKYVIAFKPWYRIPDPELRDDNPDIEDYMGYGEIVFGYRNNGALYSLLLRNNLTSDGQGAVELNVAYPLFDKVKIYAQYFYGYGESLIDYDHRVNRFSLGISLFDLL
ncbi:phospholipase A [Vibrio sp. WXL103]|uniref:phospholipase A n=1 Tax=unclassified Vibrio TaxID=2614977 RepID=UPI003EC5A147